jgi:hypothetical protein
VLRNLIAVTAIDYGRTGPDYQYGFGALNVAAMTDMINASKKNNIIVEDKVKRGKLVRYNLTLANGRKLVRICLAWIDPPGKNLVNDLDLRVISPSGKTYYPWTLNGNQPSKSAVPGDNKIDNIEVIYLYNPQGGEGWKIEVIADTIGKKKKQKYVLSLW